MIAPISIITIQMTPSLDINAAPHMNVVINEGAVQCISHALRILQDAQTQIIAQIQQEEMGRMQRAQIVAAQPGMKIPVNGRQ